MIYEICLTPTPPSCHFARHCLLFALAVSREATVLTGKEQLSTAVIQYELLLFALKSALRSVHFATGQDELICVQARTNYYFNTLSSGIFQNQTIKINFMLYFFGKKKPSCVFPRKKMVIMQRRLQKK